MGNHRLLRYVPALFAGALPSSCSPRRPTRTRSAGRSAGTTPSTPPTTAAPRRSGCASPASTRAPFADRSPVRRPGSIVDLQTIVGGTGQLAGATGELRAHGVFSTANGGESEHEGTVCLG
jgi:hypothetical protein